VEKAGSYFHADHAEGKNHKHQKDPEQEAVEGLSV